MGYNLEIISQLAMGRDLIFMDQSSQDGRRNAWTSLARGRREIEPAVLVQAMGECWWSRIFGNVGWDQTQTFSVKP